MVSGGPVITGPDLEQRNQMKARFHMVSLFQIYSVYGMRFSDLLGGFSSEAGGERILIELFSYECRKPMEIVIISLPEIKKTIMVVTGGGQFL